jgi:hypothetical protein
MAGPLTSTRDAHYLTAPHWDAQSRETARTEVVARGVRLLDLEEAGKSTIGSNGKVVVTLSLTSADDMLRTAHASEVAAITLVRADAASSAGGPDQYPPAAQAAPGSPNGTTR